MTKMTWGTFMERAKWQTKNVDTLNSVGGTVVQRGTQLCVTLSLGSLTRSGRDVIPASGTCSTCRLTSTQ